MGCDTRQTQLRRESCDAHAARNADSVDHIVIRGLGSSLNRFGIFPTVRDPALEVRNANGVTLATNDYWQQDPEHIEVANAGLAPQDGLEAALAMTLGPGIYTALLSAKTVSFVDQRGVGIVEIYSLGRLP